MGAESRCIGDRFGTVTPGDLFSPVTSDEGNGPRTPPCVAASADGNPSEVHKVTRSVTQRGSTVELSSTVSTLLTPMGRLTVLTNHQVTDFSGLASGLLFL